MLFFMDDKDYEFWREEGPTSSDEIRIHCAPDGLFDAAERMYARRAAQNAGLLSRAREETSAVLRERAKK